MNLIPLPYRLLAIATLIASCVGFGWVKGAGHVQDAWDAATVRQSLIVAHIQAKQTQATKDIDHATRSLVSRSDDYWRLRLKPLQADPVPGTTGEPDAAAPSDQADPAGAEGTPICSPADGAADAIVILGWQHVYKAWADAQTSSH